MPVLSIDDPVGSVWAKTKIELVRSSALADDFRTFLLGAETFELAISAV